MSAIWAAEADAATEAACALAELDRVVRATERKLDLQGVGPGGGLLIGFIFWYRGLARGGTAAVGQLQMLQPFLGLVLAGTLLHETDTPLMLATTLVVILCVAGARRFST